MRVAAVVKVMAAAAVPKAHDTKQISMLLHSYSGNGVADFLLTSLLQLRLLRRKTIVNLVTAKVANNRILSLLAALPSPLPLQRPRRDPYYQLP